MCFLTVTLLIFIVICVPSELVDESTHPPDIGTKVIKILAQPLYLYLNMTLPLYILKKVNFEGEHGEGCISREILYHGLKESLVVKYRGTSRVK
jgi:hypothetical protein